MFDLYDDVIENLRNDYCYVLVLEVFCYLDIGVDLLNWEEFEVLGKLYFLCDYFEEVVNLDIICILRDRFLVKVGVIKVGYYLSLEFFCYLIINWWNVKWCVFIEGVILDFFELGINEGWYYDV